MIVTRPAPAGVTVGGIPVAIGAAGSNVWVSTDGYAMRVDTATKRVTKKVAVGGTLGGIAATSTDVWVSVYDGGQVAHIKNGLVVGRTNVGGQPSGVAFDAGSVWVGNLGGWVNRIDPMTGHVLKTIPLASGVSTLLPRGNLLWAGLQAGSLVAIDPATNTKSGPSVIIASDVDALVDTPQGCGPPRSPGSPPASTPRRARSSTGSISPAAAAGSPTAAGRSGSACTTAGSSPSSIPSPER